MTIIRVGLAALLAFAVLAFGAVEIWSQSVLEIGAAALLLFWAVLILRNSEIRVFWNPIYIPFAALLLIGLGQYAFGGTAGEYLIKMEVQRFASYFVLLFLMGQAFRGGRELERLAWFVVAFCFLVSLAGIVEHFTSAGNVLWFRKVDSGGTPFGPYVNRNHFAGFIELTLPMGFALAMFRGVRREMLPLAGLLTAIPIGALILSASRGGITTFALQAGLLAVLATALARGGPASGRRWALPLLGAVLIAGLTLTAWLGAGTAIRRFSNVGRGEVSLEGRRAMFLSAARIFADHPVIGTGLGTLRDVYPRYATMYDETNVVHVHNDYMEGLSETGVLGGACGLGFLWLFFRQARGELAREQTNVSRAVHAGALVAATGLLLHSFVDFNLHIPANALLFLLQVHLATVRPVPAGRTEPRAPRRSEVAAFPGSERALA